MDLVDLIAEKRFLGQEFLTWLWYKSEERGGTIFVPSAGDISLVFEKHLLLEYGEGDHFEKLICQGLQAELKEARTGLAMGKKIEQARIQLIVADHEYRLSLRGSMLDFRNVRLPKTMAMSEEGQGSEAIEGRMLERISLQEELVKIIDELFREFLQIRVSSRWPEELKKITLWIKNG